MHNMERCAQSWMLSLAACSRSGDASGLFESDTVSFWEKSAGRPVTTSG